ncbi:MAG: hypothetical protein OXG16_02495 [Rhodospirillales bacterium]|nr:hypothetical protein [Rhodospirillales bacterium]
MAYRDPAEGRRKDRDRTARLTAARIAAGLCTGCGETEPLPERRLCVLCNEKRNAASGARDARLRAEGKPWRDRQQAKQYERERSRLQHAERKAAGISTSCGRAPARPERTTCEPCAEQHRANDRARHAKARAEVVPHAAAARPRITSTPASAKPAAPSSGSTACGTPSSSSPSAS